LERRRLETGLSAIHTNKIEFVDLPDVSDKGPGKWTNSRLTELIYLDVVFGCVDCLESILLRQFKHELSHAGCSRRLQKPVALLKVVS
jgi:hypothetical protein